MTEKQTTPFWLYGLCVGILFSATLGWTYVECEQSFSAAPGRFQDDVFYDNLACNILSGDGFSYEFENQLWRRAYESGESTVDKRWLDSVRASGPTMTRAPGYPLFLASCYGVFGRRFEAVRIIQWLILSTSLVVLLIWASRRLENCWIAIISSLTLAFDFGVLCTPGQIMSESLTISLMIAVVICCDLAWRARSVGYGVATGILFGATMLVRSNLIVWLGFTMLVIVPWIGLRELNRTKHSAQSDELNQYRQLKTWLWFGLTAAIVCSPWWIRNCLVSESLSPFGSGGAIGVVGGFSDGCLANNGNWSLPDVLETQQVTLNAISKEPLSSIDRELAIGRASTNRAGFWIRNNLREMPELSIRKTMSHLGLMGQPHWGIHLANAALLLSAFVMVYSSKHELGKLFAILTMLSILTAVVTWSHHGRYSLPLRPFWHVMSAWTTVWFWQGIFRIANRRVE